ncbi:MAG: GNAT family N-acetyltransferase, partial [Anaerolineae bacterium]|nr:GNAT family N-acetyltransferase [Anaerolineae bacterium]
IEETLWLAEGDGRIVACIFAKPHPQNPPDLYFGRLGVLPAYQRQGLARHLIEVVEGQAARGQGFQRVVLAVRIALPQNVRYFQSLGYEITGTGTHKGYEEPTFFTMAKGVERG